MHAVLPPQDPVPSAAPDLLQDLQALNWVDHTALAVVLVFFVIGLFKGLIWQVSRVAILVAAYVVAGRFGGRIAAMLAGAGDNGEPAAAGETTLYLAYVLVFLLVLIVLSLLAMLLQKLAAKAGLGFFDRLGGGVVGVATGGCVVLFGMFVVQMFFRQSQLALAAEGSYSMRWSQRAIDWLGPRVPDELRVVLELAPLQSGMHDPAHEAPVPGTPEGLPGDPVQDQPAIPPPTGPKDPPKPGEASSRRNG